MSDLQFLLLYLFLITTLVLTLVLAWVFVSYRQFLNQYFALKRESERFRAQAEHTEAALDSEREKLDQALELINTATATQYRQVLEEAQAETKKSLQAVAAEAKKASMAEVKGIGKLMQESVDMERARVAKELEGYKAEKIKQIDEQANKLIEDFSAKVLGEAIDPQQHEQLIIKALEQAKKENVL